MVLRDAQERRPIRLLAGAALVSAALASLGVAEAHDAHDPRHQAMESMGEHMKALRKAAEGPAPLGAETASHAGVLREHARELLSLFPASSRGRDGSRETPQIWSDWSGFAESAAAFQTAVDGVAAAEASGDKSRLAAALKRAGRQCAACHDRYRAPKR